MKYCIAFVASFLFASISLAQNTLYPKPLKTISKDGISVKSYDYKALEPLFKIQNDTTYVVNFWATWCMPCVAELPNFEKANAAFKNQKVKVILISLDMKKQVETSLLTFIKKRKLKSTVFYLDDPDVNTWIPLVDRNWSGSIPATVIYNKNRRKFYEQSFSYDALETEIKNFTNQ